MNETLTKIFTDGWPQFFKCPRFNRFSKCENAKVLCIHHSIDVETERHYTPALPAGDLGTGNRHYLIINWN